MAMITINQKQVESIKRHDLAIIDGQKYEIEEKISSGSFGIVFKIRDAQQKEKALKIILKQQIFDHEEEAKRIGLIYNCRAVKIKLGLKWSQNEEYPGIIMEYFPGQNLYLQKGLDLSFKQLVNLANKMIHLLAVIHFYDYMHHDLKEENYVAKFTDKSVELNIVDFGTATKLTTGLNELQQQSADQPHGTKGFCAKEISSDYKEGAKSDIYAVGLVLSGLFFANPLEETFEKLKNNEKLGYPKQPYDILNLTTSKLKPDIIKWQKITPDLTNILRHFLSHMIDNDYKKRPNTIVVENFFFSLEKLVLLSEEIDASQVASYQQQRDFHIARLRIFALDPNTKIPENINGKLLEQILEFRIPNLEESDNLDKLLIKLSQSLKDRPEDITVTEDVPKKTFRQTKGTRVLFPKVYSLFSHLCLTN